MMKRIYVDYDEYQADKASFERSLDLLREMIPKTPLPTKLEQEEHIYLLQLGFGDEWPLSQDIQLTEPAANAIADTLKAVIRYVVTPESEGAPHIIWQNVLSALNDSRVLYQQDRSKE